MIHFHRLLARFSSALGFAGALALPVRAPAADQVASNKSAEAAPLRTVGHVDLHRYMGDWRVIANIPYFGEKNCVDSIESYALRPDGRIANTFTYRKKSFAAPQKQLHALAWVTNHQTNAEWKVRFIWPFTATYLVLELDPQYQWAVVGTPGRNLLWVLARDRHVTEATYAQILNRIAAQGYDTNRLALVPQPVGI